MIAMKTPGLIASDSVMNMLSDLGCAMSLVPVSLQITGYNYWISPE